MDAKITTLLKRLSLLFVLFNVTNVSAQTDREFWFVAPEVTISHDDYRYYPDFDTTYRGGEPTMIRLSSRALASEVIITQPANPAFDTIRVYLPPNTTESVNLTALGLQSAVENTWVAGGITQKGIHIESTELITAYYEVRTRNNTDIFALKGKNALGTEFYTPFQTMSYNHRFTGTIAYSAIHIVATRDNTTITITPKENTTDGHLAGVPYTVTLQEGETYQVAPDAFSRFAEDRLAGTHIVSNLPIAITISDDSMQFPSNGCYDLFGDQLVPTSILGYEYIALRGGLDMSGRPGIKSGETLYVLATEDDTDVYINGVFQQTIDEGETYVYEFDDTIYTAHVRTQETNPVYVLHISGFGCEQGGAFLPPTSKCTGSVQVGFTRSTSEPFFLNLMVRREAFDGFILNGNPIATNIADWSEIPGDDDWLATKLTLTNSVPVEQQSLLVNTKDIFHMGVINGGASSGCRFGYFSDYNEVQVDAITTNTGTGNIRTCYGDPVQLEAYGGTDYVWTPDLYLDDNRSPNPLAYPRETMEYTVSVSGACDIVATADVTVEVAPQIDAKFFLDETQSCSPFEISIDNQSIGATDSHKWSFGDGTGFFNDATPIVTHTYINNSDTAQIRKILLVVTNLESCRDTIDRDIIVYPNPVANMSPSVTEACAPVTIGFGNTSTTANDFEWDFGDGASSPDSLPQHTYINTTGNDIIFTVTMIAENEFLCVDTTIRNVLIHPSVNAAFTVNPVEDCAPYTADFTNISTGADSYEWDFGDGTTSTSGNKNIAHVYDNSTASTQVYPISFVASNSFGCSDTIDNRSVTIHPYIEAAFSANLTVGCDSMEVVFTNTSVGGATFEWYFGDGNSSDETSPTHIFRNLSSVTQNYTVTLVAHASNLLCSDTVTQVITVYPYIRAEFQFSPSSACHTHTLNITNSSVGVDTYSWSFGDGTTSSLSDPLIQHLYTNSTNVVQQRIIELTATNNEGCISSLSRNFTLYPELDAQFTIDANNVCDSTLITFTNNSVGASTYQWTFGDGSSSSSASELHLYRNLGDITLNRTAQLVVTSNGGECADTMKRIINVRPYVKAAFSFDPSGGCSPHRTFIENNSIGADFYVWNLGDGNVSATPNNFSHVYTNSSSTDALFNIRLRVQNNEGCVDSITQVLTVYPKVTAHFSTDIGCTPLLITDFQNNSENADVYEWDFGDGSSSGLMNPVHTFNNFSNTANVTYTVELSASSEYGCTDAFDTTVTVYYGPDAQFNMSDPAGCSPYTVTIDNNSVGASSLVWNFGDGTPTQGISSASFTYDYFNSTSNIIEYPIELIATSNNGCTDTARRTAIVYPDISAQFVPDSGCHPLTISNFQNTSLGAVQWNWDFGDGTSSNVEHPTHTFENFSTSTPQEFTVTLQTTSPSGCSATETHVVVVYPSPIPEFEVGNATGCSPYEVTITNTSQGADVNTWNYGDGVSGVIDNSASFTYEYFNATSNIINYPIELLTENSFGCSNSLVRNAVVYPDISAFFTIESGCSPHTILNFNNASVGADSFNWDFGDGTTSGSENPTHSFVNFNRTTDTVINISLETSSIRGCTASYDTSITIYHKPEASFNITNPTGCSPHEISIINSSVGANSFSWNFDDGNSSTSAGGILTHTYNNAGALERAYTTELIVTSANNCADTLERVSNIYPNITSEFSAVSGCQPHTISNFNNVSQGATIYAWDFGDGNTSNLVNPSHLFNNFSNSSTQNFTVNLVTTSQYGCTASHDTTITVYPKPLAEFLLTNDEGCSPLTVSVNNNAIGADSLMWDFKDGSALSNTIASAFTHSYSNATGNTQVFNLTLEVYNNYGCSDTLYRNATVHSEITAEFEAFSGCHPHTISNFNNTSFAADSYQWNFGDGQTSNLRNPSHLFNNFSNTVDSIFTISLHTESVEGCVADKDTVISVYPKPQAEFSIQDLQGCSPFTMTFFDEASGQVNNHWIFGDGSDTLKTLNPIVTHLYNHDGPGLALIPVIQEAITEHGCTDTVIRNVTIFPNISSEFTIESGCEPHLIQDFRNVSIGGDLFYWNFGDGASSEEQNPQHMYRNFSNSIDSVYTVELRVESVYGCSATSDTQIVTYHKPLAEFVVENSPGCSPYNIELSNAAEGADSYVWNFDDGTIDTTTVEESINHLFNWDGPDLKNFNIAQIAVTEHNCTDTIRRNATIYPNITSAFDLRTSGCTPLRVNFLNESEGVQTYEWDFGDGNQSNKSWPRHTYYNYDNVNDSVHTVSLLTTSKYGCTAYKDTVITIYPKPRSDFEITGSPLCAPDSVFILNNSIGAEYMSWDFGDGNQIFDSTQYNFYHPYGNPGPNVQNYSITLFTVNDHGCNNTLVQEAVVYPDVSSQFTVTMEGCNPLTIETQNTSANVSFFDWDFGDGNNSSAFQPEHTYYNFSNTNVVQNTISLTTQSDYGCTATFDTVVNIYPNPAANFQPVVNSGCSPFPVELLNTSNGAVSYKWYDIFQGQQQLFSTSARRQFTYSMYNKSTTSAEHQLMLIVSNNQGCTDTSYQIVNIYPEVTADFSGIFNGCHPLLVEFKNESRLERTYSWNFNTGANSNAENPTKIFENESPVDSIYPVTLTVESSYHCKHDTTKYITVYPTPFAQFDVDPAIQVFPESTLGEAPVNITNQSNIGNWEYIWTMGDGTTYRTGENFSHAYQDWNQEGEYYEIELTIRNIDHPECADDLVKEVVVKSPIPEARFDITSNNGCPPHTITFTNQSEYGKGVQWDFGDGGKAKGDVASHTYFNTGIYHVIMTVEGDGGFSSIDTTITVHELPIVQFRFMDDEVQLPKESLQTINFSQFGESYLWDFGDGTYSEEEEPEHKFETEGDYTVNLTVWTEQGCKADSTSPTKVKVVAPCRIEVPNAFTPATVPSDGYYRGKEESNDIFFPAVLEDGIVEYQFEVYNKWGELIFATDDKDFGWDGFYRGRASNVDVYVWRVKATCVDGREILQKGDVTLIK